MNYTQADFSGGMRLGTELTKLQPNEYPLLINGRTRFNEVEPIKKPLQFTNNLPVEDDQNGQGLYSFGSYLIAIIDGLAYFKNFSQPDDEPFVQLSGFSMDATVDRIYATAVPASTLNFNRTLASAAVTSGLVLDATTITATPQCALFFDGVSQPLGLTPSGVVFVTQNYAQWSRDGERSYVPIGLIPLWYGGVLYLAAYDNPQSPTKKLNRILRSVSGRPLDFMVNITSAGDKLATETLGGAWTVAHAVDFDDITCIRALSDQSGGFMVGTNFNSWRVVPDYQSTLFGEATFVNRQLFPVGPISNTAVIEALGDTVIVDVTGVKSFNATMQLWTESNNVEFSAPISPLFDGILQTAEATATADFRDYIYFAVTTVYGAAVLVLDKLTNKFVALDRFEGVGAIKQFAVVKLVGEYRLFFMTVDGKVYEYFGATTSALTRFFIGEWSSGKPGVQVGCSGCNVVLRDAQADGLVSTQLYADRVQVANNTRQIKQAAAYATEPVLLPFQYQATPDTLPMTFAFTDSIRGWKFGVMVTWDCGAKLTHIAADFTLFPTKEVIIQPQDSTSTGLSSASTKFAVIGNTSPGDNLSAIQAIIRAHKPDVIVGVGNYNYPAGAASTFAAQVGNLWTPERNSLRGRTTMLFALGSVDNSTANGLKHVSEFPGRLNSRYYNYVVGNIEWFILNSGLTTTGEAIDHTTGAATGPVIEPDGIDESSEQADWLRAAMLRSTATFKFIVINLPPLSSSAEFYPGFAALRWLTTLSNKPDAIFCGGDTLFERIEINGVPLICCAYGGQTQSSFSTTINANSVVRIDDAVAGVLICEATGFDCKIQFKDVNDTVRDTRIVQL